MTGPLTDTLVIDLSRALAGPHAAMLLADLGARVIKVERPGTGDDSRGWGPPFVGPDGAGEATYFLAANRNKESIALDLADASDRSVLTDLIRRADVLVENFRPGGLARLGYTAERLAELNPGLVVLAITGFGHDGAEATRAGYDQIAQGESGLMSLTGSGPDDPQRIGVPITDLAAGIYGACGVLAALHERNGTGRGQIVRTSLLAAGVSLHAYHGSAWTVAGVRGAARGNHHPSIAPYGLFRCLDGSIQLACGSETLWRRLCAEFELDPDRPEVATNAARVAGQARLIDELESVFATVSAEALLRRLDSAGVPSGRVRGLDEVYGWEQTRSQRLLLDVEHASLGTVTLPGSALRFFTLADGESELTRTEHRPPPVLDADGASIRSWLPTADPHQ